MEAIGLEVLHATVLIRVAAGLCDVAMVLRWNIAIGLSDKAS